MKLRVIVAALFVGAVVASGALAANPGKGKPPKTGTGCKPAVAVILSGKLTADGAAAPSTLSVEVTHGNRFARAYIKATQPVVISVTTATKVNRQGDHNPADLKSGDRVNISARACRTDLAHGATPSLTAKRVAAHPGS